MPIGLRSRHSRRERELVAAMTLTQLCDQNHNQELSTDGETRRIQRILNEWDSQNQQKRALFERALIAVRAAREEGVVPGGGISLLRAGEMLGALESPGDQQPGNSAVQLACKAVLLQIAANNSQNGMQVIDQVLRNKDSTYGFNAVTNSYGDLFCQGIVEPIRVVRVALHNAVSTAVEVLSTRKLVVGVLGERPS